jgi:hypothetical protein
MKVLVVGGGGREHALAWKVAQSQRVTEVLVAPGNAGTAREARVRNIKVAADDIDGLLGIAREEQVGLTLVGPEQPLVAGIVDRFTAAGLDCFGPTAEAAQLEGSKAFCKAFLERHGIPTATHRTFSEIDPALAWIRERGAPIVVKADGLAAGKGVVVAQSTDEAEQAVRDMLGARRFGDAGRRIVVEDFLDGEEASFMALVAGGRVLPMATSQDHKARDDGDHGPNTGGMGAYSPAPVVTPSRGLSGGALHRRERRRTHRRVGLDTSPRPRRAPTCIRWDNAFWRSGTRARRSTLLVHRVQRRTGLGRSIPHLLQGRPGSSALSSSSRRVPERLMLIAGKTRFSAMRRSRWISMLPVPLNSS